MKLTSDITVLSARRYSMTDEKSGELVQGCKISYVEDWAGQNKQNSSGVSVLSANLPYDAFSQFAKLPAIFSADFEITEGARGRAVLRLVACQYKTAVAVAPAK